MPDEIDRVLKRIVDEVKRYRYSSDDTNTDRRTNASVQKILEEEFKNSEKESDEN